VRRRQILTDGALLFIEIGHGVESEPVHPESEPIDLLRWEKLP
jgi:hypothetical protein